MQYAKSRKVANGAELFGDDELRRIENETGA